MDIGSESDLGAKLSNFEPWKFCFRNREVTSPEAVLQAIKERDVGKQNQMLELVGIAAKRSGRKIKWQKEQTLWWQGAPMKRDSVEFQLFLDELFEALFSQNTEARQALLATGQEVLTHAIGNPDPTATVLTEQEFTLRLMHLRARFQKEHESSAK